MKPVTQTIFGKNGNCMTACIASILELPIEIVPHWKTPEHWYEELNKGLHKFGYFLLSFPVRKRDGVWWSPPNDVVCIAGGMSSRGLGHAVVWCNGHIIHDPHPSHEGIKKIEDFTFICQLDPGNRKFSIGRGFYDKL